MSVLLIHQCRGIDKTLDKNHAISMKSLRCLMNITVPVLLFLFCLSNFEYVGVSADFEVVQSISVKKERPIFIPCGGNLNYVVHSIYLNSARVTVARNKGVGNKSRRLKLSMCCCTCALSSPYSPCYCMAHEEGKMYITCDQSTGI